VDYAAAITGMIKVQYGKASRAALESRHAEAADLLGQGLATARALGMARVAERASRLQDDLSVLGARLASERPASPRLSTQPLPAGLTPREAEVLRLLASGKANNEIAEELVLSVYTVVRHVFNIYGKIGVRRRSEATAFALRNGLVTETLDQQPSGRE
jgi:DNA-binding CsgD family transcriptional regulator